MDVDEEGDLTPGNQIVLLADKSLTMMEAIDGNVFLVGEIDLESEVENFWLFRTLLFLDLFLITKILLTSQILLVTLLISLTWA